jgi:hypothetical protein
MYDIYAIVNTQTGRAYIGVAPSFTTRRSAHIRCLNEQRHANRDLQADWNALGPDAFQFVVIGETGKQYRNSVEGAYIAAWRYGTYNINRNKSAMRLYPVAVEIDYSRVPVPA